MIYRGLLKKRHNKDYTSIIIIEQRFIYFIKMIITIFYIFTLLLECGLMRCVNAEGKQFEHLRD